MICQAFVDISYAILMPGLDARPCSNTTMALIVAAILAKDTGRIVQEFYPRASCRLPAIQVYYPCTEPGGRANDRA